MSYTSLLIDTCTIQRYAEGARDAYGKPEPAWADHLVDEPCRLMSGIGKGTLLAGKETGQSGFFVNANVVEAGYTLFLLDVDVTEQDRVVMGTVTYEIRIVVRPQDSIGGHHKTIFMETVR